MRQLTFREALNEALHEEMARDPDVFVMGEDVGQYGGPFQIARGLYEKYGEKRVRDTPISEEIVYVLSAEDGWVRYGAGVDQLGESVSLEAGMVLHFPELEWHVFEFGDGGHVDIIYFYGQVDNIRPEDVEPDG